MKTILILGAGLSSSSLVRYLLNNSTQYNWQVRIVDQDLELVKRKINGNPNGVTLSFNALSPDERRPEIEKADLVISNMDIFPSYKKLMPDEKFFKINVF